MEPTRPRGQPNPNAIHLIKDLGLFLGWVQFHIESHLINGLRKIGILFIQLTNSIQHSLLYNISTGLKTRPGDFKV